MGCGRARQSKFHRLGAPPLRSLLSSAARTRAAACSSASRPACPGAICTAGDDSSHSWFASLRLASDVRALNADHRRHQCARPLRGGRLGPRQRRVLVSPHAFHGPRRELDRRCADRSGAQRIARASAARTLVSRRAVRTLRFGPHGSPRLERTARTRRSPSGGRTRGRRTCGRHRSGARYPKSRRGDRRNARHR